METLIENIIEGSKKLQNTVALLEITKAESEYNLAARGLKPKLLMPPSRRFSGSHQIEIDCAYLETGEGVTVTADMNPEATAYSGDDIINIVFHFEGGFMLPIDSMEEAYNLLDANACDRIERRIADIQAPDDGWDL